MTDQKNNEWPCVTCKHLGPADSTRTHTCDRPWPVLSVAQNWVAEKPRAKVYVGTHEQLHGLTPNDAIVCPAHEIE